MGLVTITGTLTTDESPARSMTSSYTIEVEGFSEETRPVGTTYELIAATADAGATYMETVVINTGAQEAVVRVNTDGTNYIFLPLPAYAQIIIPKAMVPTGTTMVAVNQVHARALTGTSILRVIALFVA